MNRNAFPACFLYFILHIIIKVAVGYLSLMSPPKIRILDLHFTFLAQFLVAFFCRVSFQWQAINLLWKFRQVEATSVLFLPQLKFLWEKTCSWPNNDGQCSIVLPLFFFELYGSISGNIISFPRLIWHKNCVDHIYLIIYSVFPQFQGYLYVFPNFNACIIRWNHCLRLEAGLLRLPSLGDFKGSWQRCEVLSRGKVAARFYASDLVALAVT